MKKRVILAILAMSTMLWAAGCGSEKESTEAPKETVEVQEDTAAEETKAPKQRGRKPKAQKSPEQAPQEQTEVKMEETATVGNAEQTNEMISIPEENNDFIAIEDLPS